MSRPATRRFARPLAPGRWFPAACALVALGSSWPEGAGGGAEAAEAAEAAAERIFDGISFAGWRHEDSHWSIEDEAITGTIPEGESLGRNLFLFWEGEVHDFELQLEVRVTGDPSANSGVQFRCLRTRDGGAAGYQADIDDGAVWLGRIYDEHGRGLVAERGTLTTIGPGGTRGVVAERDPAAVGAMVRRGDWIRYAVRAVGNRMEVSVNGERVTVLVDNETGQHDYAGSLALQLHSGPGPARIQFRNLTLAHLGRTEPPDAGAVATASSVPAGREGIEPAAPDGRSLNLGFENGTLEGWTATGTAWDSQPIRGDTVTPRRPGQASDHVGEFWVGGYEVRRSDEDRGILTSTPFEVTHPFASFLVGGGSERGTRVEIVDADSGDVLHGASGTMNENLIPSVVDLRGHLGKRIRVRVVDEESGPWGHVNYDDFRFHESLPASLAAAGTPARVRNNPILQHLRRNPAAPAPSTPALANVANTYLPEGFKAELIASEPDVVQPIAMAIDERGRLWVAEALSYPQRQPDGEGMDRITIFEDGDGDGAFETRRVFTEGLNLVSGLEVGFGGVWVAAAPELLFIPDRDRDDQPDGEPEVLLDGWGYQDTHETPNSFAWGPDGWLYGNQGVFNTSLVGRPGAPDSERVPLHAAVWRYHPTRHVFEVFAHGGSNQWGLDFDAEGELFMTHCRSYWGGGSTTHVILRGHFWNQSNSGYPDFISRDEPAHAPHLRNFLRASARYGHGEGGAGKPGSRAIYGGHSHVGTMIYQGVNWPEAYRGGLFSHNLHGHQINHQRNVPLGSGFETIHAGQDFAFVDAPDYVAVDLQYAHDGAVYIIDWADRQHCHSPHMERWDRTNGRIMRITFAETYQPSKIDLGAASDTELASLHADRNEWISRTARRLLQERAAERDLDAEALSVIAASGSGAGDVPAALRTLWTLHVTARLDEARLSAALAHPSARVRAWAVRLATDGRTASAGTREKFLALAQSDPSPVVRLALASRLADAPAEDAWPLAAALASHADDAADRNLPGMIWFGIAPRVPADVDRALGLARETAIPQLRDFIHWYLARRPESLARVVGMLDGLEGGRLRHELATLRFAVDAGAPSPMPANWGPLTGRLYGSSDEAVRSDARHLGALFADERILRDLRGVLAGDGAPASERLAAFRALARVNDRASLPRFLALLGDPALRPEVVPVLANYDDPAVPRRLIEVLPDVPPGEQGAIVGTLSARASNAVPFLEAIAAGELDRGLLTAFHVRQLRSLDDPEVARLSGEIFGTVRETAADKSEMMARIARIYSEAPLWAYSGESGREVFSQACAVCHAIGGEGGGIGPDLAGSGSNGLDYFLEAIVDPNAVVGTDYQLSLVTTKSGGVIAGTIRDESGDALSIQTLTDVQTIPVSEVAGRERLEASLMPEGLLAAMSDRQVIELLKFLLSL